MTTLAVEVTTPSIELFTITTTRCDKIGADLRLRGAVDVGGADVLRSVVEGHRRAGRRYLRVDVGAATLAEAAVTVLCDLHQRLLATRGTMIITAVPPALERVLTAADPSLLTLAATAADVSG